jgi:hypothetical protein
MGAAVVESPWRPLLLLVTGLGVLGGVLFVHVPWPTVHARREYLGGAAAVAAAVLVLVGFGHHPAAGLAAIGLLAGTSPWTLRWVSGAGWRAGP